MTQLATNENYLTSSKASLFAYGAAVSLMFIIALGVAQEMWIAPLRPGGSWLVLKIVPLLFSLRGVLKRDNYTMQWTSMLVLAYFTEGVVRASSDRTAMGVWLSAAEVLLALLCFGCTLAYLAPIKKAARAAQRAAQETP